METLGIATGMWVVSDRNRSRSKQTASVLGRCALLGLGAAAAYGLHHLRPTQAVRLSLAIAPGAVAFFSAQFVAENPAHPTLVGLSAIGAGLCVFNETVWSARYLPTLAPLFAGEGAVNAQKGEEETGLFLGGTILIALSVVGVRHLLQKIDVDSVMESLPKFR